MTTSPTSTRWLGATPAESLLRDATWTADRTSSVWPTLPAHDISSNLTVALWTSADLTKSDLPPFTLPEPFQPATGWFAISLRTWRGRIPPHQLPSRRFRVA